MPWSRDTQSPLSTRLRTLILLGLVLALVGESPLRGVGWSETGITWDTYAASLRMAEEGLRAPRA